MRALRGSLRFDSADRKVYGDATLHSGGCELEGRAARRRFVLLIGLAMLALLIEVGYVSADPFGGCNGPEGCQADNPGHRYCYGPGFDVDLEVAADHAMDISLDRDTDMYDIFDSSCTSATDVKWTDMDFGEFEEMRGTWGA
jgi:hypothetical protein